MTTYLPSRLREDLTRAGMAWLVYAADTNTLTDRDRLILCAFVAGAYHDDPRPTAREIRDLFPAPTPEH